MNCVDDLGKLDERPVGVQDNQDNHTIQTICLLAYAHMALTLFAHKGREKH